MKKLFTNVVDYGIYYNGVVLHELEDGTGYRVGWYYNSGNNGYKVLEDLTEATELYLYHEKTMIELGLLEPNPYVLHP